MLAVDRRLRYRLLTEVLYTASQAGFERYQLLVRHPEERDRVVLFEIPRTKRGGATQPRTPITVLASKASFVIRAGTMTKRIPILPGKERAAWQRLLSVLGKARPKGQLNSAPRLLGAIRVAPAPKLTIQRVVRLLDAAREVPSRIGKATPCHFVFDRKTQTFSLPKAALSSCMYPFPELSLQGGK